ncbi:hypothetical protein N9R43_00230 [bacterium]|nr:hypothetical protein [bacterium]
MKSFNNTIHIFQQYAIAGNKTDAGVYEASHTYHFPDNDTHAHKVPNRIFYIAGAIHLFDFLVEQRVLCNISDEYETHRVDFNSDIAIDCTQVRRNQLLNKDRFTFLDTFPAEVINALHNENALLYIDHAIEGFHNVRLEDVAYIFDIPVERLRWVTSCYKFRKYDTHPMGDNVIFANFFEKLMHGESINPSVKMLENFQVQMNHYKNKKKRHRLCTSYMRRMRPPRTMMALALHHHDLFKHMYWSFGILTDGQTDRKLVSSRIDTLERFIESHKSNYFFESDFNWIRSIEANITCDNHTLDTNLAFGEGSITWKHMYNTKFALVHETIPNGIDPAVAIDAPFLSEKSYKPFLTGQLFLIHGDVGTIAVLREQGYDVFDDVLDHHYDLIQDPILRTRKICEEVERLSLKTDEEWESLLLTLVERFEYNYNHISNVQYDVATYIADPASLVSGTKCISHAPKHHPR